MASTGTLMSAEEFDQLPVVEGRRIELLEGELIDLSSATPEHNEIQARLIASLHVPVSSRHGRIWPVTEFALGANRFQPDLAILLDDNWRQCDRRKIPVNLVPDIVVEIISPSETAYRVDAKIQTYLRHGVKEVWVIYSSNPPHIFVHQRSGIAMLEIDDLLSTPLLPNWSMALQDIFDTVE